MNFPRKQFNSAQTIIFSERPLFASYLEEKISTAIPAMESIINSFETYLDAYSHCTELRTVGVLYLHFQEKNTFPLNIVDELAASFEYIGSTAGLFIVAENERALVSAYKIYRDSPRLLGIVLESDLESITMLKKIILESWHKFEHLQKENAVSQVEINFILKILGRYENADLIARLTNILTSKLERDWYDDALVDIGPAVLGIPDPQQWVLNNSPALTKLKEHLNKFTNYTIEDLIESKDDDTVSRAVTLAYRLYCEIKQGTFETTLDQITRKASAFSPTLVKILKQENSNLVRLLNLERKAA